jgi:hypothetical protein
MKYAWHPFNLHVSVHMYTCLDLPFVVLCLAVVLYSQLKELQMAAESDNTTPASTPPPQSHSSPIRQEKQQLSTQMASPKNLHPMTTSVADSSSSGVASDQAATRSSIPKTTSSASKAQLPDSMSNLSSIINTSTGRKVVAADSSSSSSSSSLHVTSAVSITAATAVSAKSTDPPIHATPAPAKPRTKAEVKNQHPPADLKYSTADIGRRIEMYSYKFATWDQIELVDFNETSGSMHKCRSTSDKSEKWIDLKKKPIRGLAVRREEEEEGD